MNFFCNDYANYYNGILIFMYGIMYNCEFQNPVFATNTLTDFLSGNIFSFQLNK